MSNLNIFTDGGSRGNPGNAGIGGVIFKSRKGADLKEIKSSEVLHEFSDFIGVSTNNEAEYEAFLKALEWLLKNNEGVEEASFYLDSKLVVEQMNKNWKIKDERMKVFTKKAWIILSKIDAEVSFIHIRREKNKEADALVNQALDAHIE